MTPIKSGEADEAGDVFTHTARQQGMLGML